MLHFFYQGSVHCPHTFCPSVPANMAEDELAELVDGNQCGMYKASFADDDAPRVVPSDAKHQTENWHHTVDNELRVAPEKHPDQKDSHVGDEAQSKLRKLMDEFDIIPELREWSEGAGSCVYACKAQASARVDVPTAPM